MTKLDALFLGAPASPHGAANKQPAIKQACKLGSEFVRLEPVAIVNSHVDGMTAELHQWKGQSHNLAIAGMARFTLISQSEGLVDQRSRRRHVSLRQQIGGKGEVKRIGQNELSSATIIFAWRAIESNAE